MDVETEIRGKLDKINFPRIFKFLQKKAKLLDYYKRLSVDLSPGFDPVTRTWDKCAKLDLRIKRSANTEKISLKIGESHLKERLEIDVKLKEGEFLNVIKLFEHLGFDRCMVYFCESWEFLYKNCEVKLAKFGDYYHWEIESKNKDSDIESIAKELDLIPFTPEEYVSNYQWMNQNVHRPFSLELVEKILKEEF